MDVGYLLSIVAFTPGLSLTSATRLKSYTKNRTRLPTNGNSDTTSSKELLLRSEDDSKLQYTGKEEEVEEDDGGANAGGPYLKHYVGIYNPETGNLEVMEARNMVVRGVVRQHQPLPEDLSAMVCIMRDILNNANDRRIIAIKRMHSDRRSEPRKRRKQFLRLQKTQSPQRRRIEIRQLVLRS